MKAKYPILFVCLLIASAGGLRAAENPFGWDISYKTVFSYNHVPANDTILKYFVDASERRGNSKDMFLSDDLFTGIKIDKLQQAVLVDYQAYWYFGQRSTMLLLNYGDTAQVRLYNTKSYKVEYRDLKPEKSTALADRLVHRTPSKPIGGYNFKAVDGYTFNGYVGVVSTYTKGQTHQYLITVEDLLTPDRQQGEISKLAQKIVRASKPAATP